MKRNVRDKALAEPYVQKLLQYTARRFERLTSLVEQMTFCSEHLNELSAKVEAHFDTKKVKAFLPKASLLWRWRAHPNKAKASRIEPFLLFDERAKGGAITSVSMRSRALRTERVTPLFGLRDARRFTRDMDRFLSAADQTVGWINALPGEPLGILNDTSSKYGLAAWIQAVARLSELLSSRASSLVESFLILDEEINQLIFEFNAARQPVRLHSIICRRDCSALDLLSPAEPKFRVIDNFNRRTGRRTSLDVQSYKKKLALIRLKAKLKKLLCREPSVEEVNLALSKQRKRSPTPSLTEELISHCKLGRHTAEIVRHQKMIAQVMDEWEAKRQTLQALLKQR